MLSWLMGEYLIASRQPCPNDTTYLECPPTGQQGGLCSRAPPQRSMGQPTPLSSCHCWTDVTPLSDCREQILIKPPGFNDVFILLLDFGEENCITPPHIGEYVVALHPDFWEEAMLHPLALRMMLYLCQLNCARAACPYLSSCPGLNLRL